MLVRIYVDIWSLSRLSHEHSYNWIHLIIQHLFGQHISYLILHPQNVFLPSFSPISPLIGNDMLQV